LDALPFVKLIGDTERTVLNALARTVADDSGLDHTLQLIYRSTISDLSSDLTHTSLERPASAELKAIHNGKNAVDAKQTRASLLDLVNKPRKPLRTHAVLPFAA
jgi:hypothetical protein